MSRTRWWSHSRKAAPGALLAVLAVALWAAVGAGPAFASGGEYTIGGLPSGNYRVSFFAGNEVGNYLYQYYNGKPTATEAGEVGVTAPNPTNGINAALQTGGQISGRVAAASSGAPLAHVFVEAFGAAGSEEYVEFAETNSNGEYAVGALHTGNYKVVFFAFEGGYAAQYYNGKANFAEAETVAVTAPNNTSGINAALQTAAAVPHGQISGRVVNASANPVEGVEACAYGETDACATTNSNGEYVIEGLLGGEYYVSFEGQPKGYLFQYYNEKSFLETPDKVLVTVGATTANINAKLNTGGRITGTVTAAAGGKPIAEVEVCASAPETLASCASTNGAGQYEIAGLESSEKYTVTFDAGPENLYEAQYYNGKKIGETPDLVPVLAPEAKSGIDAKMALAGQITGTVTAASNGAPVAKVFVCAGGECALTNSGGEYSINGLQTGKYVVQFIPFEETGNYLGQFYAGKSTAEEANQVEVTSGSVTSGINAVLQLGGTISGVVTSADTQATLGGVFVCAFELTGEHVTRCAKTSAGETKPPPVVTPPPPTPNSSFASTKAPSFNAKTGILTFYFTVAQAGTFRWSLFFKNADVAFADALGVGPGALASGPAVAEAAKKCKKGYTKHHGKCKRVLIPFGSGSKAVSAGAVQIKVHASSKALKGLKRGHKLHVSGAFTFQSSVGGSAVSHSESATLRPAKKKHKKH